MAHLRAARGVGQPAAVRDVPCRRSGRTTGQIRGQRRPAVWRKQVHRGVGRDGGLDGPAFRAWRPSRSAPGLRRKQGRQLGTTGRLPRQSGFGRPTLRPSERRRSDGAGRGQAHDRLRGIRSSGADVVALALLGAARVGACRNPASTGPCLGWKRGLRDDRSRRLSAASPRETRLWRGGGGLRFRPTDLSRTRSGAPDRSAAPGPRARARRKAGRSGPTVMIASGPKAWRDAQVARSGSLAGLVAQPSFPNGTGTLGRLSLPDRAESGSLADSAARATMRKSGSLRERRLGDG